MGGEGGAGRTPAELNAAELASKVRTGYDAAAAGWADGPERVYEPLARALVGAAPRPVAGGRVLDLGAGTGPASRAALAAGADRVVAADLAVTMLGLAGPGTHPVAADAVALPFRDQVFDLVVAAFCLNHLDRPGSALREARRVGRGLAASTFAPGWTHPAKAAVDDVLRSFGFKPPAWYVSMPRQAGLTARSPERLGDQAAHAGFSDVRLRTIVVPTSLATPAQLASWRLGLAHVAPFLQSLAAGRRAAVRRAAEQAVSGTGPLVVSMLVLTAC